MVILGKPYKPFNKPDGRFLVRAVIHHGAILTGKQIMQIVPTLLVSEQMGDFVAASEKYENWVLGWS